MRGLQDSLEGNEVGRPSSSAAQVLEKSSEVTKSTARPHSQKYPFSADWIFEVACHSIVTTAVFWMYNSVIKICYKHSRCQLVEGSMLAS